MPLSYTEKKVHGIVLYTKQSNTYHRLCALGRRDTCLCLTQTRKYVTMCYTQSKVGDSEAYTICDSVLQRKNVTLSYTEKCDIVLYRKT